MKSVHIYPSTFEYETRMLKVTKTLVTQTDIDEVIIIAQTADHLPAHQYIDNQREVRRISTKLRGDRFWAKAARFVEWSARVNMALRGEAIDIVNCHSLSVLPLCALLATLRGATLIYEPHELETETVTFSGRRKWLAKALERLLIRRAKRVIVVSDSIAQHYQDEYKLRLLPDVILNVPSRSANIPQRSRLLRELYNIKDDELIFMYQGVLDATRGTNLLLDAFRELPQHFHIVFLGFGPMETEITVATEKHSNIHIHAAVPPEKVLEYTAAADIGFALLERSCLNHECALPNKLFHYIHAGLPVIVSDLTEMGSLVNQWKCGWRCENDPQAIATRVREITPKIRESATVGALSCRDALNWDNEAMKLVAIYDELFKSGSSTPFSSH